MFSPGKLENDVLVLNPSAANFRTGTNDVHVTRMRKAVIWSILLQFLIIFTFEFFVFVNITNPFEWLSGCITALMSFEVWVALTILIIVIYIKGEVTKKDYVTDPNFSSTRFQKVKQVFSVKNVLLLLLNTIMGVAFVCIYSSLSFYPSLTKECTDSIVNQDCLAETKMFILLGGLWLGLYVFAKDYMFGSRNLIFPLIQQYKIYRIKAAINKNIKQSISKAFLPTVLYFFLYFFYGGFLRNRFIELIGSKMDSRIWPIDSIQGIMDIQLFLTLWLFSWIFLVTMQMMELIFNVYLTEHCDFPILTELLPPGNYLNLGESLQKNNPPIIQHLGYLDLYTLSTHFPKRRQEIFTLSNPGGHPHSWNKIYLECSNLIKTFTTDLNIILEENKTVKKDETRQIMPSNLEPVRFNLPANNTIRRLAPPQETSNTTLTPESKSVVEDALNAIQLWLMDKQELLYKKPVVAYFFAELPDARINNLLSQSQPVIWAVQSLAYLASASLLEDNYGIVQKDLQSIIVAIVALKQVLDKLFKQSLIVKKSFAKDSLEIQMKYLLRTAVKRSLYKLAVSFGPYIKGLKLPCDVEIQMNGFVDFREVL